MYHVLSDKRRASEAVSDAITVQRRSSEAVSQAQAHAKRDDPEIELNRELMRSSRFQCIYPELCRFRHLTPLYNFKCAE